MAEPVVDHNERDRVEFTKLVAATPYSNAELCRLLVNPVQGLPITTHALQHWLHGRRRVPLWALQRLRQLATKGGRR